MKAKLKVIYFLMLTTKCRSIMYFICTGKVGVKKKILSKNKKNFKIKKKIQWL